MSTRSVLLPPRHALLALAVMAVWGLNFVVTKLGLGHLPPLLFACLRFTFAFFPAALFIRRPVFSLPLLIGYGLSIGVVQFGVLFIAMRHLISPGLASLLIQSQVFFTIGFAMVSHGERVKLFQWGALALATIGIAIILGHNGGDARPLGILLVLISAMGWSMGNIISSYAHGVDMLGFVVWSSLPGAASLFILSLLFEGPSAITNALSQAGAGTWAVIAYQSLGNTLFGYGVWGWLLARYPAATISPLSLMVPVFGMGASWLWLGESLPDWKLAAAGLVLAGLALNFLWPRFQARLSPAA